MTTTSIPATQLRAGDIVDTSNALHSGGPKVQIDRVALVDDKVYVSVVGRLGMYCWPTDERVAVHEFAGDRITR